MSDSKLFDLEVQERERLAKEEPEKLEALFREDIENIIKMVAQGSQKRAEAFQAELDQVRTQFKPGSMELIGALIQRSVLLLSGQYHEVLSSQNKVIKKKNSTLHIH